MGLCSHRTTTISLCCFFTLFVNPFASVLHGSLKENQFCISQDIWQNHFLLNFLSMHLGLSILSDQQIYGGGGRSLPFFLTKLRFFKCKIRVPDVSACTFSNRTSTLSKNLGSSPEDKGVLKC